MKRAVPIAAGVLIATTAAAGAIAAPPGRTLSIGASKNPIVFGGGVTLSGTLTGNNPGGKTVTLRADPFPFDHFSPVATTTTDSGGHYSFSQKPGVNTRYQTRVPGTASSILTELVRLRVSMHLSDTTPAVGQRIRVSGRACPANNGALVKIQRRLHLHSPYRTVATAHLVASTGGCSKYSRRLRVFHTARFRVLAAGAPAHATGISSTRRETVH